MIAPDSVLIPIFLTLFSAISGAFIQRVFSRRAQRYRATLELFDRYNSLDMLDARREAWQFLNARYNELNCPVSVLYDGEAHPELKQAYAALVRVANFWYLLAIYKKENELLPKLARKMFSKQFADWDKAFASLVEQTLNGEEAPLEWIETFSDKDLHWLLN